jgi:hypothetical protein
MIQLVNMQIAREQYAYVASYVLKEESGRPSDKGYDCTAF